MEEYSVLTLQLLVILPFFNTLDRQRGIKMWGRKKVEATEPTLESRQLNKVAIYFWHGVLLTLVPCVLSLFVRASFVSGQLASQKVLLEERVYANSLWHPL